MGHLLVVKIYVAAAMLLGVGAVLMAYVKRDHATANQLMIDAVGLMGIAVVLVTLHRLSPPLP